MKKQIVHCDVEVLFEVERRSETWVVFLHGWALPSSFNEVMKNVSASVLKINFPPFGGSGEPKQPWGLETYASLVSSILKKENVENPIVVAHSFGARVAILMASQNAVFSGAVLCAPAGFKTKKSVATKAKICIVKVLKKFKIKPPKSFESPEYSVLGTVMKQTFSAITQRTLEKEAKQIRLPTIIIVGKKDDQTPPEQCRRMANAIENSRIVEVENATHAITITHPALIEMAIEEMTQQTQKERSKEK